MCLVLKSYLKNVYYYLYLDIDISYQYVGNHNLLDLEKM